MEEIFKGDFWGPEIYKNLFFENILLPIHDFDAIIFEKAYLYFFKYALAKSGL